MNKMMKTMFVMCAFAAQAEWKGNVCNATYTMKTAKAMTNVNCNEQFIGGIITECANKQPGWHSILPNGEKYYFVWITADGYALVYAKDAEGIENLHNTTNAPANVESYIQTLQKGIANFFQ